MAIVNLETQINLEITITLETPLLTWKSHYLLGKAIISFQVNYGVTKLIVAFPS